MRGVRRVLYNPSTGAPILLVNLPFGRVAPQSSRSEAHSPGVVDVTAGWWCMKCGAPATYLMTSADPRYGVGVCQAGLRTTTAYSSRRGVRKSSGSWSVSSTRSESSGPGAARPSRFWPGMRGSEIVSR